jgi:DNA-binding transcriptional MerR regulator
MEIRIGELAKRTRCEIVTIRYYEKEGAIAKASAQRRQLPAIR